MYVYLCNRAGKKARQVPPGGSKDSLKSLVHTLEQKEKSCRGAGTGLEVSDG